jgi:diaminopimelate epimerase
MSASPASASGAPAIEVSFTKVQGAGNDYLYLDGIAGPLPEDLPALARAMSERHFGPGADGLITIERGGRAPLRMRMWNADGSEGRMCGNGMRGFAKLCYERRYVPDGATAFDVETAAGLIRPTVLPEGGSVQRVEVDMGEPRFRRAQIPMEGPPGGECLDEPLEFGAEVVRVSAVSMGNPHAIIFVEDAERAPVRVLGRRIEGDPLFPERVNVHFVQVAGPALLRVRSWERGSGETLACGTGACASVVAAVRTGRAQRTAAVDVPGGRLDVDWGADNHVRLTGPTVRVYDGIYRPG